MTFEMNMTPFEMHERANALAQMGSFEQAIELGSAALACLREELGEEDPQLILSITNLATYYASLERWEEALPYYYDGLARKIRQYGDDHPSCAKTLYRIARCHVGLRDVDAAMSAYRQSVAIFNRHPESKHWIHRSALSELAELANEAGYRAEAGELRRQIVRLSAQSFMSGDGDGDGDDDWETLVDASAAFLLGQDPDGLMSAIRDGVGPADGIILLDRITDLMLDWRRSAGTAAADDATRKGRRASAFTRALGRLQRHPEARERLAQIVATRRSELPFDSSGLAIALCDLGEAAARAHDFDGAVRAAVEAFEVLPPQDPLRSVVAIKARCFELERAAEPENVERPHALAEQGRFREAEPAFRQLLNLQSWLFGATDLRTIPAQNGLGVSLGKLGRLAEAEAILTNAHKILVATPGAPTAHLAAVTGHLAVVRRRLGQFEEAEPLHETAMELSRQLGDRSREYALALINAGAFYKDVGRYDRARTLYELAQPIVAETVGRKHADYILLLSNLAHLELDFRNAARAVELLSEACSVARSSLGECHDYYLSALHNLGCAQRELGQDAEALVTLERALTLKQEALGPDDVSLAPTLTALAEIQDERGCPDLAGTLFERSLRLRTKAYGDRHVSVARARGMVAQYAWKAGMFDKARTEFSAALSLHRQQLVDFLPGMTEDDRASYWGEVRPVLDLFTAFALSDTARNPETAGDLYDLHLFSKALMLQCVVNMRAAAAVSAEKDIGPHYDDWLAAKRLLASALLSESPQPPAIGVDQLSAKAAELEKVLARLVGHDVIMAGVGDVNWRDVHGALAPCEAAIEIVRSPFSGFPSPAESEYVALVLRGNAPGPPQLVTLGSAAALEGVALERYLDHRDVIWPGSYDDFWRPLRPMLAGITRAYLAPDGVYSRLDLNILFSSDEKAFLGDTLDLRIVTSSRDILNQPASPAAGRTASLFGRPAYTAPARSSGQLGALALFDTLDMPGHFPDLPGTQLEVLQIASILEQHGWRVEQFMGEHASKTAIQRLACPQVLHLATHGFYLEPRQTIFGSPTRGAIAMLGPLDEDAPGAAPFLRALADNGFSRHAAPLVSQQVGSLAGIPVLDPLFRSGVALAGASSSPDATFNPAGILTAYEAAALNLHGTELVVLSACDSARGELQAGEGTFGLMRALRTAGAQCVLGAVWPVDDTIAREFMTLFYQSWVDSGDARRAFKDTQQTMRATYRLPLLWGGFVLVA